MMSVADSKPFIIRFGCVETILPPQFKLAFEQMNSVGNNWLFRYQSNKDETVSVSFYYRGFPSSADTSLRFRSLLKEKDHLLFNSKSVLSSGTRSQSDPGLFFSGLIDLLGNAGDNQFVNKEVGLRGPAFEVAELRTQLVNERVLLRLGGIFGSGETNFYEGVFYDGDPAAKKAQIEECFLLAPSKSLFDEYVPCFESILHSFKWLPTDNI